MNPQYRLTFSDDYMITANLRYRQQFRGYYWFLGLKWLLALMLSAIGMITATVAKFWLVLPFVLLASFLFISWPLDKATIRRRQLELPRRGEALVLTLSEDGLLAKGEEAEVKIAWSDFTKARRFKDGLLLCRGVQPYWLPDTGASVPEAIAEALRMAKSNVRDFHDV